MERSNRCAADRAVLGRLLITVTMGALLGACGPTKSTALIMDADVQLQAAKTADAEKLAPFEYTAAAEYLHKAREEQGYSDFEVSIDFGEKAVKFATEAKEKAMAAKADGVVPGAPADHVPPPAPALNPANDEPTLP